MEILYPVCCGIDVHKKLVVACLRRALAAGEVKTEKRTFGTTMSDLGALATWLAEEQCPVVAMESTGVYWRPVYHVLSGGFEVLVANAREVHQRPGKKTDKQDAEWISELLAHGLIKPSFIPPPKIGALRDLTRTRVKLIEARTDAKNRVHKILEDTNIKLASVVADLFGKSARNMLNELVNGERNPATLAMFALGKMKAKIPALELALAGQFTEHHAVLIGLSLRLIDGFDREIKVIDEQIDQLVGPMTASIEQLDSIPGIHSIAARLILAETGTDMSRFGSSGRLASWAGVCPGNNESAGKRKSGKTCPGNRWLRRILVECAWAARKTETFIGRMFRRLEKRLGGKKAALAVAHKILVIAYEILTNGTFYDEELHNRPNPKREELWRKRIVSRLEQAGYRVTLEPIAATT